jgi:hypothetical protein
MHATSDPDPGAGCPGHAPVFRSLRTSPVRCRACHESPDPGHRSRDGEKGTALLIVVAGMAVIVLSIVTGLTLVELAGNLIGSELKYQGQTLNSADAGLTEALSWFQRQSTQPVTAFNPVRDLTATPPINDSEVASIGIVRTYRVSSLGNVWGRYEIRRSNVTDVSIQRGKPQAGTIWQVEADGILFRDANNDSQFTWNDANGNGVYDQGEPGEALAMKKARVEFQRLSLVLPAGNAAVQGSTCSTINTTTGTVSTRVQGSSSGTGIGCRSGTGSPTTTGTSVTGSPAIQTGVNPFNAGVSDIFGVTQSELLSLANLTVPDVASLPAALPAMSLIVIQGDATFTTSRPLVGSGVLVVFGNLVIPSNSASNYNGVIYVTGNYSQSAPSTVHGAVVCTGNINLVGGGDFAEVDWDAALVQQVRNQVGGYRFSRSEYFVP